MNNKLIISYIVALLFLAGGVMGFKKLGLKKEKKSPPITKIIPGVRVSKVLNSLKPISIKSNGSLVARNKIDLFSEVQGVFESSAHLYKPGVAYNKGDVLLQINSDEFRANLQIQKSNLYQRLVSILPDLRLDYPDQFEKWNSYINAFDMTRSVTTLPSYDNQKEKLFITGRGIPTAYYMVKNLQERQSKYTIYAPFYGILTEANLNTGTLINPGQRLGTFISPSIYELELSISASTAKFINLGEKLMLNTLDKKNSWAGKVTRINPIVDPQSQSLTVYVQVRGKGLQEGMYLEANIESKNNIPVVEVNRSLLLDNDEVYVVNQDSILSVKSISVLYLGEKTALISGLEDGSIMLSQALPGAYDGKVVKIVKDK